MSNLVPSVSLSSLYGLVSSPLKGNSTPAVSPSPTPPSLSTTPPTPNPYLSSRSSGVDPAHHNHQQHQVVTSRATGAAYLHPAHHQYHTNVPEAQLQLSTECPSCSHPVVLKVPSALLAAANNGMNQQGSRLEMERYGADGRLIEGPHQRAPGNQQLTEKERREEWRAGVVGGAVKAAKAFKESRFPEMIMNLFRLFVAFILWLDTTFSLHQRLMIVFWAVLEDLVKIEREVGILRNSGEAISVLWEAAVKGTIAFAKSDDGHTGFAGPPPVSGPPPPSPMHYPASHYGPNSAMYPFPTYEQQSFPPSPSYRAATAGYPGSASPSAYNQPSFAYTSEDEISTIDMSSSDQETTPQKNLSGSGLRQRKTLRRTAYSTPSFKDQLAGLSNPGDIAPRSGSSTPGAASEASTRLAAEEYFDHAPRPNMVRRRSRSGPEEKSRREGRGWAGMVAGAVAGRIRPSG